jgi:ParB family transcriptional regulator, chromosome partitioning protein
MTMQTVSLLSLEPGRGNPRKAMDRRSLEGLAASIRNDGLLQNLVVSPVKGKGQHYRIVSGERRFRALKLLQERGDLDEDFAVPVEIRVSLSKDDSLRLATVENLQRQNLTPLEETAALTKLIHKGSALDDVVARTGLSQTTIKRRLALNGLCEVARAALAEGSIGLSQAEAMTWAAMKCSGTFWRRSRAGASSPAKTSRRHCWMTGPRSLPRSFPWSNTPARSRPTSLPRTKPRISMTGSSSLP